MESFRIRRRLIRSISNDRVFSGVRQLNVEPKGWHGLTWRNENELPELIVKAHFLNRKDLLNKGGGHE